MDRDTSSHARAVRAGRSLGCLGRRGSPPALPGPVRAAKAARGGGVLNRDGAASPPRALIGAESVLNYERDHQLSQGCQGC